MLKDFPHPLVIKFYDSFRDNEDNVYLVIEFAEFSDLRKDMEKRFEKGQNYSDEESKNIIF